MEFKSIQTCFCRGSDCTDSKKASAYLGVDALTSGQNPLQCEHFGSIFVFLRLSREAFDGYWLPKLYKAEGEPMSIAFRKSEQEILAIAAKVTWNWIRTRA